MAELITVAEYSSLHEAHLLASRLEAAGIRAFVVDGNMNTLLAMGSVKVQVNLHDSLEAMDILYDEGAASQE